MSYCIMSGNVAAHLFLVVEYLISYHIRCSHHLYNVYNITLSKIAVCYTIIQRRRDLSLAVLDYVGLQRVTIHYII